MTESDVLVLAGTGKTGRRVLAALDALGVPARGAARSGADLRFDWDDPTTHAAALAGVDRVYLVPPSLRLDHAGQVSDFLDLAGTAGVRHVTYLSAYGIQHAPPEVALRAVELDLAGREFTHSIVRPAWFMQNFSESFFLPGVLEGQLVAPTGGGTEAFVDADDIAAVVAQTLRDPAAHAGAEYAPTGPEALTMAEAATLVADAAGRPVRHVDLPVDDWAAGAVAGGVPADYAGLLGQLFGNIASGQGSRPNGDVERITGRPPGTFADYARSAAGAWRAQAQV